MGSCVSVVFSCLCIAFNSLKYSTIVNWVVARLQILYLDSNGLSGTIPASISRLSQLHHLHMYHNRALAGTIPATIGELRMLVQFLADRNSFSGVIPTEFGMLTKLEILDISHNRLSSTLPDELGKLTLLKRLSLQEQRSPAAIFGILPSFFNMKKLSELELQTNKLNGSISNSFLSNYEKKDELVSVSIYIDVISNCIHLLLIFQCACGT